MSKNAASKRSAPYTIVPKATDRMKKSSSVIEKRLSLPEGNRVIVRCLDANAPSFGTDLRYVFERNVERVLRKSRRTKAK